MNTLLAALTLIVVVLGLFVFGILLAVWKTWWLHPLWALLIVPLGIPAINFWHFLAINMFVHAIAGPRDQSDCKKDPEGAVGRLTGNLLAVVFWPVITYYLVLWYMN